MNKTVFVAVLGGLVLLTFASATAGQATSQNSIYRSLNAGKPAHSAGTVRGKVVSIDYVRSEITVKTGHATELVAVVPSTAFYHGRQYATLSDLRRGQRVEIDVSEIDGSLVAQTVRF
jgi:Cu/Ag efflux protein CusF